MMCQHVHDDAAAFVKLREPVIAQTLETAERQIHVAETNFSEKILFEQFLHFHGFIHMAADKSDGEEFAVTLTKGKQFIRQREITAERFLAEQILAGGNRRADSVLMRVSRGGNNHAIRFGGNFFRTVADFRSVFFMHFLCGFRLRIIHSRNPDIIFAFFQCGQIRRVVLSHASRTDDSELHHLLHSFLDSVFLAGNTRYLFFII